MTVSTVGSDDIAKEIAGYVHRGLRVVRLNGLARPGECTCWKRGDCGSPGKHPHGKPWETTTDEDQVFQWWAAGSRFNVGVVLGDAGRGTGPAVIDIESDSDEATAELRRLGLDRVETPTWSSGRGLHRLFLWSPELPDTAMMDSCRFEVRIGGGGKQAQSVMPPSAHHSGRHYRWEPGFGLADVEIAKVPDNVMEVILAAQRRTPATPAGADGGNGRRATAILRGPVGEGQRNDSLFRFACLLVRSVGLGDDAMEQALLDGLRAMNTTHCRPPLTDEEVKSVFRSAIKYRREAAATEAIFPGVAAVVEGPQTVYRPAGLELTIHAGDPTMFELRCEEFRRFNPSGAVRVPPEVWSDSRKMKTAMIGAFPGVPFDRHPGDFARIWDGLAPQAATGTRGPREAVTGLRVLLEREATAAGRRIEVTDPAEHNTRRLIELMVSHLDRIADRGPAPCEVRQEDPSDDQILAEIVSLRTGGWAAGRIWFNWERLWRDIALNYGFERDAPAKAARALPEILGRKLEPQRFQRHSIRATLRSLTGQELELLRAFAAGGATGAMASAWGANALALEPEKGVAGVAATQAAAE